ncbi:hypothetical protein RQP46_007232 [Phenoliferia psychrophenolica]
MSTFGILQSRHYPDGKVPGTALIDDRTQLFSADVVGNLKHGTGRNSHVVLVPQPSDDPRDPLNWPRWKKEACFWSICYTAGLVGAVGPLLAPGYVLLAGEWGVSVPKVAATNGALILALAFMMLVQAPFAVKFGRRPVFLVATAILFFSSIWSGVSNGLQSMAPFEALVTATIGDMFFVHETSARVAMLNATINSAIWGFALIGGINVAPIINGYVAGVNGAIDDFEKESVEKPTTSHLEKSAGLRQYLPAKTFVEELAFWSGYRSKDSLLKSFLRPFPFLLSPAVIFAVFSYGITVGLTPFPSHQAERPVADPLTLKCWLVVLSVISSIIFASPPYFFTASETGLVSIGPLVASILTAVVGGPLTDYAAMWFARRNNGIFEPEARLFLLLPMLLLQVVGFAGWAAMQKANLNYMGPVIMYSLINAGQALGSTAIVAYIIDIHRDNTPEALAIINFTKNILLYILIQFVADWVIGSGVNQTLNVLAGLTAVCVLTGVPMYIYGKRARAFVARNPKLFLTT